MTIHFDELPAFKKELKRLAKKYESLPDDLEEFRNVVSTGPLGNSKHFNVVTQIRDLSIVKARLFCRYLKRSSLRIIYAYSEKNQRIDLIELSGKGKKANEDRDRINEYVSNH